MWDDHAVDQLLDRRDAAERASTAGIEGDQFEQKNDYMDSFKVGKGG